MIIHGGKQWVVITPPKTGSCSLNRLLLSGQFKGTFWADGWHHNTEIPAWAAGFAVHLSVRNPFARASSLYRHQWRDAYVEEPIRPFSRFAERCLLDHASGPAYWQTLCDWWPHDAAPIRLEHWREDLERLRPDGPYIIPAENVDPRLEHWTTAYDRDPAAWGLVAEWAKADCERFGYSNSGRWPVDSGQ